jgi:hypothetical protein
MVWYEVGIECMRFNSKECYICNNMVYDIIRWYGGVGWYVVE